MAVRLTDHPRSLDLEPTADGVSFAVRLAPRAARSAITGVHDGALKVAVAAPPVDGEANAELCALLAKRLGVPKRAVTITRGERSKSKRVHVLGVDAGAVLALVPAEQPGP